MFGKKAGRDNAVVVTTKKELEKAVRDRVPCIEVRGGLVKKLKWMQKLKPVAVAALLPLLAAPAVPVSMFAASMALPASVTAVGITAKEISLCMLSAAALLAVLKNYNIEAGSGENYIRFIKK